MTQISDEDIETLKALAKAATPGPWVNTPNGRNGSAGGFYGGGQKHQHLIGYIWGVYARGLTLQEQANLYFVLGANPATVLSLITRAEAAEKERDEAWNAAIEAAALVVDNGQETVNSHGSRRSIERRRPGNLMSTAYAPAIRALKRKEPT